MSSGPWRQGDPTSVSGWRELAGQVYAGIRDGNLGREAAFDLACFLMDWAQPDPLVSELAEESAEGSDQDRRADLARRVLELAEFVPDFELEPRLLTTLEQHLAVVTADLRNTGLHGLVQLVIQDQGEPPHAYVRYDGRFGHTSGLAPSDGDGSDPAAALVLVADELQDAVMDSLFAVWPVCPRHDRGAHPRVIGDRGVWRCEAGAGPGHVVADIGRLGQ